MVELILNITNWYTNYNIKITFLSSIVQSTIWKKSPVHITSQKFWQIFMPEQTFHVAKVAKLVSVVKFEILFTQQKKIIIFLYFCYYWISFSFYIYLTYINFIRYIPSFFSNLVQWFR